jgi:plasmid maintenance system killer protein
MKISYQNNKLEKQLTSASEIKKAFGMNAKKVAQRMSEIEVSPNLAVLMQIPAARCHRLKGDLAGEWAVSISPNHRLLFEIADDPVPRKDNGEIDTILMKEIKILTTTDYH